MKRLSYLIVISALIMGGVIFMVGRDLDKGAEAFQAGDFDTAIEEWLPMAESGNVVFQYNLGLAYVRLDDFSEALKWFRLAAAQDFSSAQVDLGVMYGLGQGVPQSDAEAIKWYRLAAEQGNARGQTNLAWKYYQGQGVAQDYAESVKWYRLAAEQGYDVAQYNLGVMTAKGVGLPQDYGKAAYWYQLAATQNHTNAQHNLGLSYLLGKGKIQSPVLAHMWLNIASANGHPQSPTSRDELASTMTSADISKAHEMAGECVNSDFKSCDG